MPSVLILTKDELTSLSMNFQIAATVQIERGASSCGPQSSVDCPDERRRGGRTRRHLAGGSGRRLHRRPRPRSTYHLLTRVSVWAVLLSRRLVASSIRGAVKDHLQSQPNQRLLGWFQITAKFYNRILFLVPSRASIYHYVEFKLNSISTNKKFVFELYAMTNRRTR